jgi:twitching motility protein PilJ
MNRTLRVLTTLLISLAFALSTASSAAAEYSIGVLAKRGAAKAMQKYKPLAEYLSEKTGEKFKIVPLKFTAIEPALKAKQIDFLLANSAFYVEMEKKHSVSAIASLVNSKEGKALKEFGGVIFVKADSPIKSVEDIKGKKFMAVKKSSFGGCHMAWRHLLEKGIDIMKDTSFLEGQKHDNVVLAVKNGAADAGTVRTDTLERMAKEGKISLDDFRVIDPMEDDFPFLRSTRLYPEWPMAKAAGTDDALASKVADALKALSKDSPAAQAASIVGWVDPLDYTPVANCLKAIKYGAFAN